MSSSKTLHESLIETRRLCESFKNTPIGSLMHYFIELQSKTSVSISRMLSNTENQYTVNSRNEIKSLFVRSMSAEGSPSLSSAARSSDRLIQRFRDFSGDLFAHELSQFIEGFLDNAERTQKTGDPAATIEAMRVASRTVWLIESASMYANSILSEHASPPDTDTTKSVDLSLDSANELAAVESQLALIREIYNLCCKSLGVDPDDSPFKLYRFEFASINGLFSGATEPIVLMTDLLRKGGEALRRRVTFEGKLDRIVSQGDSIKSIVEVRKQMAECGIQTPELDESAKALAEDMSQKITKLLNNQNSIRVDGKRYLATSPSHQNAQYQNRLPQNSSSNPDYFASDDDNDLVPNDT